MIRNIFSIIAGSIVAYIIISLVELASLWVYPLPEGVNLADEASMKAYMKEMPQGVFFLLLVAYAAGSLVGGAVAAFINTKMKLAASIGVAAVLTIMGFINLASLPHPVWFWIAGSAIYLPFAWLGGRQVVKRMERNVS